MNQGYQGNARVLAGHPLLAALQQVVGEAGYFSIADSAQTRTRVRVVSLSLDEFQQVELLVRWQGTDGSIHSSWVAWQEVELDSGRSIGEVLAGAASSSVPGAKTADGLIREVLLRWHKRPQLLMADGSVRDLEQMGEALARHLGRFGGS